MLEFCEELYISGVRSPHLLAFIIDMYEEICLKKSDGHDVELLAAKLSEICQGLASTHDAIRCKYWKYVEDRFKIAFERSKLKGNQCRTNLNFEADGSNAQDNSVPF